MPSRHPKKAPPPPSGAAHGPIVRPGDSAARAPSSSAPDRARLRHRLVRLATMPSGHGPTSLPQPIRATVVLDSRWCFPSPKARHGHVVALERIPPWTFHSLRHTFASIGVELGHLE